MAVGLRGRRGAVIAAVFVVSAAGCGRSSAPTGNAAAALRGACADSPWIGAAAVAAGPDARAAALLACMTQDEKIALLGGDDATGVLNPPVGTPHTGTNAGIARLGIPTTYFTDGPVGVRQGSATAMPAPEALAASFDPALARAYGAVIGNEARHKGNDVLFGPCVDHVRNPLAGRTFETFGEDPLLTRSLATEWIRGVQGEGVIATVKHYAGNNQEPNRNVLDAEIDERTLRELYLPAYEGAVRDAGVGTAMCAYNSVNGAFMCENGPLLNDILRNEWGFKGYVVSDYPATRSTAGALNGGLDLELPLAFFYTAPNIGAALAAGEVTQATIDARTLSILRTMFAFGQFDRAPYVADDSAIDQAAHDAVARAVAERGMVLLKNAAPAGATAALLPLDAATLKSLALIGKDATAYRSSGSPSSGTVTPFSAVTPADGIKTRAPGLAVTTDDGSVPARAAATAAAADAAIVFVSSDEREFVDRPCMTLLCSNPGYGDQDGLITSVLAANPRTLVVVESGAPVLMPWADSVPAVVQSWYMGQQGGNALARLLFGDVNFSGKLPLTFWAAEGDTPTYGDPSRYPGLPGSTVPGATFTATYSEGLLTGYRWADQRNLVPRFPFGYGLSYTHFAYDNLRLSSAANGASASVTVRVRNTGARAGREIAQLYLSLPSPGPGVQQPPWQLKGFASVDLAAGASQDVSFALDARALSYWDASSHGWRVAPGCYRVRAGASSRDFSLPSAAFSVGGAVCP